MTIFFGAVAAMLVLILAMSVVSFLDMERPLNPAEIAQLSAYCRGDGMKPVLYTNGHDSSIRSVQCEAQP